MKAQNFWDSSRSSAFLDVRLFNLHAPSNCKTSTAACYWRHELEKRRAYERRIIEVEHGSYTSIVLSTSGGWGLLVTIAFARLADLLSIKHSQQPGIHEVQDCILADRIHNHVPPRSQIFIPQSCPQQPHQLVGRTVHWTSLRTRPGSSIDLAWLTISYNMPWEMLLAIILCFHVNVYTI